MATRGLPADPNAINIAFDRREPETLVLSYPKPDDVLQDEAEERKRWREGVIARGAAKRSSAGDE